MKINNLNLPPFYSDPNAPKEYKEVFETYKKMLEKARNKSRGTIMDSFGNILWQEDEEQYKIRLQKIREEDYKHFMSCCKAACHRCESYAKESYSTLRKIVQESDDKH